MTHKIKFLDIFDGHARNKRRKKRSRKAASYCSSVKNRMKAVLHRKRRYFLNTLKTNFPGVCQENE